jgi:hypothetical protein
METATAEQEIETFINSWGDGNSSVKSGFLELYRHARAMAGVKFHFVGRSGVSYSLRPRGSRQRQGEFFAIIDVIDDDPEARWLSVCFYGEMITDPANRGEVIPGGLAGADGYCFDVAGEEAGVIDYLQERCREAWTRVS